MVGLAADVAPVEDVGESLAPDAIAEDGARAGEAALVSAGPGAGAHADAMAAKAPQATRAERDGAVPVAQTSSARA
jgi:hypothetical protein